MSNEGFKVQASIKDADGDMVNFRADSPEELSHYLTAFPYADYAAAKAALRGAGAAAPIVQPAQQAPAQPQAAPAWSWPQQQAPQQRQGGNHPSAQLHPEGKACEQCGTTLEHKKTQTGKAKWQCPQWRWNNGSPNGHTSEWLN